MGWWVSWSLGWLWRRTVWQRIGADARALSGGRDPVPVWGGWRVQVGDAVVTWRGGLLGVGTSIKRGAGRERVGRLLDEAAVRERLRSTATD